MQRPAIVFALILSLTACGSETAGLDAAAGDASGDAGPSDTAASDTGRTDLGPRDTGADVGVTDSGGSDLGLPDAGGSSMTLYRDSFVSQGLWLFSTDPAGERATAGIDNGLLTLGVTSRSGGCPRASAGIMLSLPPFSPDFPHSEFVLRFANTTVDGGDLASVQLTRTPHRIVVDLLQVGSIAPGAILTVRTDTSTTARADISGTPVPEAAVTFDTSPAFLGGAQLGLRTCNTVVGSATIAISELEIRALR